MPDNITSMLQNMVDSLHGKIGRMAERSQQAEKQSSLLMLAAEAGQEDIICHLLGRGENINTETEPGWTALKKAVSGHHPTIVRLLAQRGAIMSAGSHGFTALHLAALLDDVECAEALLDCGADMNVQTTEFGSTPLLEAMSEGDGNFRGPKVARLLIKRGAEVAVQDIESRTALDYALNYYDCWAAFPDSEWLGESQRDLIELVRQTVAAQAKTQHLAS